MARKTTTSTDVKNRWNAKTYRRVTVNIRQEEDAEIIRFMDENREKIGPTEIFRAGYEKLKTEGK